MHEEEGTRKGRKGRDKAKCESRVSGESGTIIKGWRRGDGKEGRGEEDK